MCPYVVKTANHEIRPQREIDIEAVISHVSAINQQVKPSLKTAKMCRLFLEWKDHGFRPSWYHRDMK